MEGKTWYTLITGASQGIGREMAFECAGKGMNLILVALPGKELEETAATIRNQYPVKVHHLGQDMMEETAAQKIYNWCVEKGLFVNILINNAGQGMVGTFDSHSAEFYDALIRLNTVTPVLLTRLFLPQMRQAPYAHILNTSSIAAFFDIPHKIIYSATKAFLYSFSRSLRQELRGTKINVTVLCPGYVVTSPEIQNRAEKFGKLSTWFQIGPREVGNIAIGKMLQKKALVLPDFSAKLIYSLSLVPIPYSFRLRLLAYLFGKDRQKKKKKEKSQQASQTIGIGS